MKIDQKEQEFQPVTVTLESLEELVELEREIGGVLNGDISKEHTVKLHRELRQLLKKYGKTNATLNLDNPEVKTNLGEIKVGDTVKLISIHYTELSMGHTEYMYRVGEEFEVDYVTKYFIEDTTGYSYSIKDVQKV